MGFGINPIKIGGDIISAADDLKDKAIETTVEAVASLINNDAARIAFSSFGLQGQIARVALEKILDGGEK